jgi:hypothetical protein
MFAAMMRRAVVRGEIPADRDWSLVADVTAAMGILTLASSVVESQANARRASFGRFLSVRSAAWRYGPAL